jgi:serine/threonine protein kinase
MIPKLPDGYSHPMSAGEGAFGSVYRVKQKYLDRWVALKTIPEKSSTKRKEYCKEAKILARITSPYVPQIYDAFEWHQNVCIVMQWIRGVSLSTLFEESLTKSERISIAAGLIDALADLHEQGVAHRDLKPANIFWEPGKGVILVDFGFSRNVNDLQKSKNTIQGTPAYMAPELRLGNPDVDMMRADVYSAGTVLNDVLDGCDADKFTERLLARDPLKRLSSGIEVKKVWSDYSSDLIGGNNSFNKAELKTAEKISGRLSDAARILIGSKKFDEGYDLLLEALEEDPDNHEAVEQMSRYGSLSKRPLKTMPICIMLTLVIGTAVLVSYRIGMNSGQRSVIKSVSDEDVKVYLKGDEEVVPDPTFPVRQNDDKSGNLDGWIIVDVPVITGYIMIDSTRYDANTTIDKKIKSGQHEVQWIDRDGALLYREAVTILPFQTKRIPLPMQKKAEQSR